MAMEKRRQLGEIPAFLWPRKRRRKNPPSDFWEESVDDWRPTHNA